jgi:hypothetical protein
VPRRRFFHLSRHRVQAAPVVDPAIEQDSRYFGRVANVVEWIFGETRQIGDLSDLDRSEQATALSRLL